MIFDLYMIVGKAGFYEKRAAKRLLSKGLTAKEAASLGGLARSKNCSPRKLKAIAKLAVASRSSEDRRACMLKNKPWKFRKTVLAQKQHSTGE